MSYNLFWIMNVLMNELESIILFTNFPLSLYKNVNMVSVLWCKYYDSISYLILHDFYLASFHSLQIFDAALHSSLVLSHCFVISSEAAAVLLLLST